MEFNATVFKKVDLPEALEPVSKTPFSVEMLFLIPPMVIPVVLMVFFWELNVPRNLSIWEILSFFLIATMAIDYPLDHWLGLGLEAKLLRPLVMVVVAMALYCLVTVVTAAISVPFYQKLKPYLVPAVFNDLTLGLAMVANHKVTLTFWGTIGLAVGSCVGFMLVGWLILEGRSRINSHAVPLAFRGAPVILIYLGLAALAMLGFGSSILL